MKTLRGALTAQRFDLLWLTVATLAITLVIFLSGLWGSGGHLAPALDDTFIHFQYGKQLAAGYPFQYNTGDPASSGDSSFIYPFILAPAYLVGLGGMKTLLYADALNLLAHLIAVILLYKLALHLFNRRVALLAAFFLLLDGRLNWSFLTGMETGLYAGALIAFFYAWVRGTPHNRFALTAWAGVIVSLLRPEGHIIISIVSLATLVYAWKSAGFRREYLWLILPVLAGLIPYIVNITVTGQLQFNTATSKSLLYIPYMPLYQKLSLIVGYFITMMKDVYFGLEIGRSPFPFFTLPVAAVGLTQALSQRRNRMGVLLLVITLLVGLGLALLLPPTHFYRYYQPYDFIIWLFFAYGSVWLLDWAGKLFSRSQDSINVANTKVAYVGLTVLTVLFMLPQFVAYFFAFGDSTRDIYYQQMTFSEWVRRYTPPDTRIAVNDTGAHKYLSDRYVLDLIGLTSNYMQGAQFSGWGTVFDRLAALPEGERPTYLLVHPNLFGGLDESISQSLLKPVYSIRVQNPIITAGDTETLYKIDWGAALLDPQVTYLLHKGENPLDTLNVGYLDDERAHGYKLEGRQASIEEPKSIVTTAPYEAKGFTLTESGRRHSGWEEFAVKSIAGRSLTVVMRTRLASDANQTVLVSANGREVGLWKMQNDRGGAWQEYEYTIPAEFITAERTTLRIDATFDPGGGGFSNYRYWFYTP